MGAKKASANRLVLPEPEWPAVDRQAWKAAREKGDIFGETGRAANWSVASEIKFTGRYGRWLGWVLRGNPAADSMSPGERVTPEAVLQFIEHLKASGNSEVTIHAHIRSLLTGMLMFAPEADWSWLRIVETNLRKAMKPSVDKRHQVRPVRELFAYGLRLMDEAEKSKSPDRVNVAVQYRDGLLIAIFASRAPRRGVVTLMEIGTHLIREGDLYWLVFDETEMKGGRHSDKYLPAVLTPHMTRYLDYHRRSLLRDPDGLSDVPGVWIGEHARPIGGPGIRSAVCKRTEAEFGVAIPPHRFRDCLATSFAYEDPANLRAATSVLDHASPEMVDRHYNQSQRHVALMRVHSNLDELRERLKPVYERWKLERENPSDDGGNVV
jgi:integrase/recombinase XerD